MATLSKEEVENIVKELYPVISYKLRPEIAGRPYPKAEIHAWAFSKIYPAIKREGITPDVFCKIAGALSEKGIATDIDAPFFSYITSFIFAPAGKGYRKPSPETCRKRLDRAKKIEMRYNHKLSV